MSSIDTLHVYTGNLIALSAVLCLLLFLLGIYINRETIKDVLNINAIDLALCATVFVLALSLRQFVPPHQHIMYIDEPWYMEAAKNLLQTMHQGDYIKSIGWPLIISIAFSVFGISNWVAINTTMILGALTPIAVYFLSISIHKNKTASLASAIIFCLFPVHIRFSTCAESNVSSLFFVVISLLFSNIYFKTSDRKALWSAILSISFTALFRPENYILLPLFCLGCMIFNHKKIFDTVKGLVMPCLVFILLTFPNFINVLRAAIGGNETIGREVGVEVSGWSVEYLVQNSIEYGFALLNADYQPWLISLLYISGLVLMFRKLRETATYLLFYFLIFWLSYFGGPFHTHAGSERFLTTFYPVTAVFAGFAIVPFSELFKNRNSIGTLIPITTIAVVLLLFVPYISISKNMYAQSHNALETGIPEVAEKEIGTACLVVSAKPEILRATTELKVISIEEYAVKKEAGGFDKKPGCLLFFKDLACEMWEASRQQCSMIEAEHRLKPYRLFERDAVKYGFYSME